MPVRFHLDEHIPASVAAGLRRRGIDVTTTIEAGLVGVEDQTQGEVSRAGGATFQAARRGLIRSRSDASLSVALRTS